MTLLGTHAAFESLNAKLAAAVGRRTSGSIPSFVCVVAKIQ